MRQATHSAALALFLCVLGCSDPTLLGYNECHRPCYTGPEDSLNVGECQSGWPRCNDRGRMIDCVGEITPQAERCDGLDTNCNGMLDDDASSFLNCGHAWVGNCRPGQVWCEGGVEVCKGGRGGSDEDCSGLDMDCNGIANDIPEELCYTGDIDELRPPASACRAGIIGCSHGQPACLGETKPQPEVCGVELDLDCNGLIMDVDLDPTDIVLVVDRSGSMSDKDPEIVAALRTLAHRLELEDVHFTLVHVPGRAWDSFPATILNGVRGEELTEYLEHFPQGLGGAEYSYDAFLGVANGSLAPSLRREARKLLIWIGDEGGQSGSLASMYELEQASAQALYEAGIIFVGFVNLEDYSADYDDIAIRTQGKLYSVSLPRYEFMTALSFFTFSCDR